jgi:hypothetical protein
VLLGREDFGKDVFGVVSLGLFLVLVVFSSAASGVDQNRGGKLDE